MGTIEFGTKVRTRLLGLPYGDQVLIVRKDTFFEVGMYKELELMEDAELVLRLRKKGHMHILEADVETSGRRWLILGKVATTLLNWLIVLLFFVGVDTALLKKLYYGAYKAAQKRKGETSHTPSKEK